MGDAIILFLAHFSVYYSERPKNDKQNYLSLPLSFRRRSQTKHFARNDIIETANNNEMETPKIIIKPYNIATGVGLDALPYLRICRRFKTVLF
jgi:hypothetical protein